MRLPHEGVLASPTVTVRRFTNALLAKVSRAIGSPSGAELEMVRTHLRDGWELRDADEWVQTTLDVNKDLQGVRAFLKIARDHDTRSGTDFARHAAIIIQDIFALVVPTASHSAGDEASAAKALAWLVDESLVQWWE